MRSFFEKNFQALLNRYLALDPESRHRLHALQNHVITIALNGTPFTFQLIFTEAHISVKTADFVTADTIITGTPLSLIHMTLTSGDRKKFFADDVSISGNIELGQQVIDLFDTLEIDWEEYLSRITGDIPAHRIHHTVSRFKNFTMRLQNTLMQNINEYIHEEKNISPPREALQDFFHDVDQLRMDTDRLEARVVRLEKKMLRKKGDLA